MSDVDHEREPAGDARVTRGRGRQKQESGRDEREPRQPLEPFAGKVQCCDDEREDRLGGPDFAESRIEHGGDDIPIQRLAEPEAARRRTLKDNPGERDRSQAEGRGGEEQREPSPGLGRGGGESDDQHQRPTANKEEQQEVERPHDGKEQRHRARCAAPEYLRCDAGRVCSRLIDVEDERA